MGLIRRARNRLRDRLGHGNAGKWTDYYRDLSAPRPYDDETTYQLAADFLSDVELVEDWGCGSGGFRPFCRVAYRGVDGSPSKFADVVADLETYRSDVPAVMMRGVLEHNYRWRPILGNAIASFREKMCLVLFTPFAGTTREIGYDHDFGVPDIAFARDDIVAMLAPLEWSSEENIATGTQYGVEQVFYLRKADGGLSAA